MHAKTSVSLPCLTLFLAATASASSNNVVPNGDFEFPVSGPGALGWTVETEGSGQVDFVPNGIRNDGTGAVQLSVNGVDDVARLVSDCITLPPGLAAPLLLTVRHRNAVGSDAGSGLAYSFFSDPNCQTSSGGGSQSAIVARQGQWDLLWMTVSSASLRLTLTRAATSPTFNRVLFDDVALRAAGRIDEFRSRIWRQSDLLSGEDDAAFDEFGGVIAVGDFNADGFDDAAFGVPDEDLTGIAPTDRGHVVVAFGSLTGLSASGAQSLTPAQSTQPGQRAGSALAAGDFNCDGIDDLAVGIADFDAVAIPSSLPDSGQIVVFDGSPQGLDASSETLVNRLTGDIAGSPEAGDRFGAALAAGNFNGDSDPITNRECDDLAIGAPGAEIGGQDEAGAVFLVFGTSSGLDTDFGASNQLWSQARSGVPGAAEPMDRFGEALLAFDFGGDFVDDLAIAAPGEDFKQDTGAVHLLPGAAGSTQMDISNTDLVSAGLLGTPNIIYDAFGAALAAGIDYNATNQFRGLAVGAPLTSIPLPPVDAGVALQFAPANSASAPDILQPDSLQFGGRFGARVAYADTLNQGLRGELWIAEPGRDSDAGRVRLVGRDLVDGSTVPTTDFELSDFLSPIVAGDRFGEALARGNFNGYGGDELLIGVPGWEVSLRGIGGSNSGAVVEVTWDEPFRNPDELFRDGFESPSAL